MFLNLLDRDEKLAFALLAEKMIQADGIVVGREAAAVVALRAEMGLEKVGEDERSIKELAQTFEDRRSRVAALLELLGLGYSDTSYSVGERSLVTEVAQEMGMTPDDLRQLEDWVRQHVELVKRAMVLLRD